MLNVYNLVFPLLCDRIEVHGHVFAAVAEYRDRLDDLQIDESSMPLSLGELAGTPRLGAHAITATMERPQPDPGAVLPHGGRWQPAYRDLEILLRLFTRRDVFVADEHSALEQALERDTRPFAFGDLLHTAVRPQIGTTAVDSVMSLRNIGLQLSMERVYTTIRSEDWQKEYQQGAFLLLALEAFKARRNEAAFSQCWTIWEHLFAAHNAAWMTRSDIERAPARSKIAFCLVHYGFASRVDQKARLDELVRTRNCLVHNGRFPDEVDRTQNHARALLFVRLTEMLVCKTLGLRPLDLLRTQEQLEQFLDTGQVRSTESP